MKRLLLSALILAAAALATTARADTFNLQYTGQADDSAASSIIPVSFDLTLTGNADPVNSGVYDITEIFSTDSTVNGLAVSFDDIVDFDPAGFGGASNFIQPSGYDNDAGMYYDNLYYMSAQPIDLNGLGFTAGGDFFNLFAVSGEDGGGGDGGVTADDDGPSSIYIVDYGMPVSTTPEPSSLLLLGSGLAGIGAAIRRKAKSC